MFAAFSNNRALAMAERPVQNEPEWLTQSVRARTTIVIPALNEASVIGEIVRTLRGSFPNVIVVDDGSVDGTAEQARQAGAIVLTHLTNRGQGAALRTGIVHALRDGAHYIVTFDGDGQHDVADLPAMIGPIARGEVEVCLGSRFLGTAAAIPRLRRFVLRAAVLFTRITSRQRITDAHNGLRALSRKAALKLDLKLNRMAHASEIIDQIGESGLPYREVPVHIRYTDYSCKKGQRSVAALRVAFDYLLQRVTG